MPTIDDKVVKMSFDNKQFEAGVSESLKTIDKLKEALNFDEVEGSLKNIENAFNNLNLSGLADSVDFIASRFEPLGKIADKALGAISDKVVDAGKKIGDAFFGFSDMSAGQEKYETYTKAVQTITNATGKSIEEVEKVLKDLQHYTDETSYDFSTMVETIGKFTSVGVDLKAAEIAMEGIGNEAAESGASIQQANHAMYNFAQALSQGVVKRQDWNSIATANMSTKKFKETLIDTAIELGVLEKRGDNIGSIVTTNQKQLEAGEAALKKANKSTTDRAEKIAAAQKKISDATKETTVDFKSFENTLQDGWLTTDVLIKALDKYANDKSAYEAAQKALTFKDAIQAVKDAISSGWMDSFVYLFGNLEEAKILWTDFCNSLIRFTDIFTSWRNTVLEGWHELGGYNDMIEAAKNLWETFMNIVKGVGEALSTVFPILKPENMTQALVDGTKKLKDWSAGLLEMFGIYQEVEEEEEETAEAADEIKENIDSANESATALNETMGGVSETAKSTVSSVGGIETGLKRGMRGEKVKKLQKYLMSLGYKLDRFGADGIYGPETEAAVKKLQKDLGLIEDGIFNEGTKIEADNVGDEWLKAKNKNRGLERGSRGEDVKKLQNELNQYLEKSQQLIVDGIYGPKTEAAVKKLQKALGVAQTGVWDETTKKAAKTKKILLMDIKDMSKMMKEGARGDAVKKFQEELIKGGYLDKGMADGIYGPKTKEAVQKLQKALGVKETGEWDKATWNAFHNAQHATEYAKAIEKANKKNAESAKKSGEASEEAGKKAKKTTGSTTIAMMRLQNITKGIAAAMKIVGKFAASGIKIFKNIIGMYKPLVDVFYRFGSYIGGMFENLASDLDKNNFYDSLVQKVTDAFGPFGDFIKGVADGIGSFLDAYDAFLEATGKRNTFGSFFEFLGDYIKKIPVLGLIVDVFKTIKSIVGPIVSFLIEELEKLIGWFGSDAFKKAKSDVFGWIGDRLKGIQKVINEFRQNHPELTIENFLNKIKEIGGWAGRKFGKGIEIIKDKFGDFGAAINDFVKNHPEFAIENIFDKIKTIFGDISGVIKDLFAGEQKSESGSFIDELKERLKSFQPVLDWFEGVKDKIAKIWSDLFGGKDTGNVDGVEKTVTAQISTFDSMKEKMSGFESVVDWFINLKDKLIGAWNELTGMNGKDGPDIAKEGGFTTVFDKLGEFMNEIGKIDLGKVISTALKAVAVYSLLNISKGIKDFGKGAGSFGESIEKAVGKLIDPFSKIADKVANEIDFKKISEKLSKALSERIKFGKRDTDTIGTSALKLAGSLLMVVAAIAIITKVVKDNKQQDLDKALWIVGGAVAALGIIAVLVAKYSKGENSGNFNFSGLLALCAGIFVLVLAIEKVIQVITGSNQDTLTKALLIVGGALVALGTIAVLVALFSKNESSGIKGILSLCAGVYVLILALEKTIQVISGANEDAVNKALLIVGGALVALGLIAVLIAALTKKGNSVTGVKGILSLCEGVFVLVLALERVVSLIVNTNDNGIIWQAVGIIAIMVILLGAIAVLIAALSKHETVKVKIFKSLVGAVVTLVGLVAAMTALIAQYNPGLVWQAFAMIALLVGGLGAIAVLMGGKETDKWTNLSSAAVFLSMAFMVSKIVETIGDVLTKIKDVDPKLLKWFFIGIDAAIGILAGLVLAFTKIPLGSILSADVGLLAFIGVLATGMEMIGTVAADLVEKFSYVIQTLGYCLQSFGKSTSSLDPNKLSYVLTFVKDLLPQLIKAIIRLKTGEAIKKSEMLVDIGIDIEAFGESISEITGSTLNSADNTIKLMNKSKTIIDKLNAITFPSPFKTAAMDMFGAGLALYGDEIDGVKTNNISNVKQFIEDSLGVMENVKNATWLGSVTSNIQLLGAAVKQYYKSFEDVQVDEEGNAIEPKNLNIEGMAEYIRRLAGSFQDDTTIQQISSFAEGGSNDMTLVSLGITALGTALETYADSIGKLSGKETEIALANGVVSKVEEINKSYNKDEIEKFYDNNTGEFFSGTNIVSANIIELGTALGTYADKISVIKPRKVDAANKVIDKILEINQYLDKKGEVYSVLQTLSEAVEIPEDYTFHGFTRNVRKLGRALKAYGEYIKELDINQIQYANKIINSVARLNNNMPLKPGWFLNMLYNVETLQTFGTGLEALGEGLANYWNAIKDLTFDDSKREIANKILDGIADIAIKLSRGGNWISQARSSVPSIKGFTDGLGQVGTDLVAFSQNIQGFNPNKTTEAVNILNGIADAMSKISWDDLNHATGLFGMGGSQSKFKEVGAGIGELFAALSASANAELKSDDGEASANLLETGQLIVDVIAKGVYNSNIDLLRQRIYEAIDTAQFQALIVLSPIMEGFGKDILKYTENGLKNEQRLKGIVDAIATIVTNIRNTFTSKYELFKGLGKFIDLGIMLGIQLNQPLVVRAMEQVAINALNAAKKVLGIASPSKEFIWIGEMADEGLAKGFSENLAIVNKAVTGVQSSLTGAFSDIRERILEAARNGSKNRGLSEFWKTFLFEHASQRAIYDAVEQSITGEINPGQMIRKAVYDSGTDIENGISAIGDFIKMGVNGIKDSGIGDTLANLFIGEDKMNYMKAAFGQMRNELRPMIASLFEGDSFAINYDQMDSWYKVLYSKIQEMLKEIDDYEIHRTLGDILANQMDTGNVDALKRNILTGADMLSAGWEEFKDSVDEIVTYYSGGYSGIVGNVPYALTATPIDANGNVLSPSDFDDYVYRLIDESANIDDLMQKDMPANGGKGLVLHYTPVVDENWDAAEEAENLYGQVLHTIDAAFEQGRLEEYGGKNTSVSDYLIGLLRTGIEDPSLKQVMGDEIKTVLDNLIANNPEIKNSIGTGLFNAFNKDQIDLSKPVGVALEVAADYGIDKAKTVFEKTGVSSMVNLIAGVSKMRKEVKDKVIDVVNNAKDKVLEYKDQFISAGSWIAGGLAQGVRNAVNMVIKAMEWVATSALNAAKAVLGIASPSREFMWVGEMADKGLANGLSAYSDIVKNAAGTVANDAVETAIKSALALNEAIGMDADYQPTIRPVLDLSAVKVGVDQMNSMISSKSNVLAATRSSFLASGIAASQHEGNARKKELDEAPRLKGFADSMDKVNEKLQGMVDEIKNMKIYMDGNTLVGYMSPRVNRTLGQQATLAGRMN